MEEEQQRQQAEQAARQAEQQRQQAEQAARQAEQQRQQAQQERQNRIANCKSNCYLPQYNPAYANCEQQACCSNNMIYN
ncbi:MAG: hypothetical protein ACP5JP_09925, partial [bacterium]